MRVYEIDVTKQEEKEQPMTYKTLYYSETELNCSRCNVMIGRHIMVNGEELIQIGSLVVSEIHGNCARCGEEFHYSLNSKRLEQLIQHVLRDKILKSEK